MNTKTNTGGPAFARPAVYGLASPEQDGMSLRQYAAIKLRVPNSGTDWLDEMIVQSLRDEFAAKAMPVHMAALSTWNAGSQEAWHNAIARISYATADAMLEARGQ